MSYIRSQAILIAFLLALTATLGSLYAQHIGYEPCSLCWWQRIFLYPLVLLIPVGVWLKDVRVKWYALALAIPGALVALYHTLLYYGIVSEALAPCTVGVPCTQILPDFYGITFITASLGTFLAIIVLLISSKQSHG